jgi:C-3',4' desaturase CrtD
VLDLIVIGGGLGGLATAALAARCGRRVALVEAHVNLGGCAGYFERGPCCFDVGATALIGLEGIEPLGGLLEWVGASVEWERTRAYRVHLPDRAIDIEQDSARFEAAIARSFPGVGRSVRRFWRLQEWVGERLLCSIRRIPRMPMRGIGDAVFDLHALGFSGLAAAATSSLTVDQVARLLGARGDFAHRAFVDMLLQDTAQAGAATVPFANAAACLQAYRRGMSRPRGGMRGLAEGLGRAIERWGGEVRRGSIVDRVEPRLGGFEVITRRRVRLWAREVVFNLPIDLAARMLGRDLSKGVGRSEEKSRAEWSAFTGYVAVRSDAIDPDTPLFHQVLASYDRPMHDGNNALVSVSPRNDSGYGPADVRVATISTHVRPEDWRELEAAAYAERKAEMRGRLLGALDRALPGATGAMVHEEFGTPRTFGRYTRRTGGRVGGAPVSRRNSNLFAVGSDVLGPGLWLVGDSVFPGQGTLAVVVSAIRVVERIVGKSWESMRRDEDSVELPRNGGGTEKAHPSRNRARAGS